MLFNSLGFLFVFLPVTYLVFWRLRGKDGEVRVAGDQRLRLLLVLELQVLRADALFHRGQLPGRPWPAPVAGSSTPAAVRGASGRDGSRVINLTPVFAVAAARSLDRGEYLYWLEDIHWNARGIALAAATVHQRWRLTDASCRASRPLVVETSHDESQQ